MEREINSWREKEIVEERINIAGKRRKMTGESRNRVRKRR